MRHRITEANRPDEEPVWKTGGDSVARGFESHGFRIMLVAAFARTRGCPDSPAVWRQRLRKDDVLAEQLGVLATLSRWRSWVQIPSGTLTGIDQEKRYCGCRPSADGVRPKAESRWPTAEIPFSERKLKNQRPRGAAECSRPRHGRDRGFESHRGLLAEVRSQRSEIKNGTMRERE